MVLVVNNCIEIVYCRRIVIVNTSTPRRSILKTITWRCVATTDTFLIAWLITGEYTFAGAIAGLEICTKMVLYYLHERGWSRIKIS